MDRDDRDRNLGRDPDKDKEGGGGLGREGESAADDRVNGRRDDDRRDDRRDDRDERLGDDRREYAPEGAPKPGRGMGIAALIVSILALLSIVIIGPLNILLAIAGLILGIIATMRGSRGLGITSIVLSSLAGLLGILALVGLIALFSNPEFQQQLEQLQQQ